MAMQVGTFFNQFKQVKVFLQQHPDASAELQGEFTKLNEAFKKSFTADAFKQALADNTAVDSNLEELITTATLLLNKERTTRGAE